MENELGIMPTANWGGSDNHTKLAAMTAERDRLREALSNLEDEVLNKIDAWANAYPVDVFIEPTKKDWQKRNAVLKENGLSPDAFSGSNYRHCLSGMQGYAKRGMEIIAALREPTDEPTPVKTMTQREWDLRRANPYDLSGPHQPQMKRGLND